MSVNKYYSKKYAQYEIHWKNFTDTTTPLSAANLQKSHSAIDSIDQAVEDGFNDVDRDKMDRTEAATMITNVQYNQNTGSFVFSFYNGTTRTINTNLEKIVVNFAYNSTSQKLELTQDDGTIVEVDLSSLIANPDLVDSNTITWTVNQDGSISADIINGSITDSKLESGYLASVTEQAANAEDSAEDAQYFANLAKSYANGTSNLTDRPTENVDNADYYRGLAQQDALKAEGYAVGKQNGTSVTSGNTYYHNNASYFASNANSSKTAAATSATNAANSATAAATSETNAASSATTASTKATEAATSATNAASSATSANASKTAAATSETNANNSALKAEGHAIGKQNGIDVTSESPYYHKSAQYFAELAQSAAQGQGAADMTGATANADGTHGLIKQPHAGDQEKFFKGDGTWSNKEFSVLKVTDSTPYLYRQGIATGGMYDKLIGGSVVWNQLVQNGNFANNSGWTSNPPSGGVIADNKLTLTNASSNSASIKNNDAIPFVNGHRYLVTYTITPNINTTNTCSRLYLSGSLDVSGRAVAVTANKRTVIANVITANATCNGYVYCYVDKGNGNASVSIFENVNCIDLTLMFGDTIADYVNALETAEAESGIAWIKSYGFFSKDYYAYNAGQILSVNTSGHKLTGKNIFNPDTMTQTNYKNGVGVRDGNLYTITVPSGFSNNSGIYLTWASGTKAKYSIFPRLKLTFEYKGNGAFDCGFGMDGTSTTGASVTTDWKTFEQTINESNLSSIKFYIKSTVSGAHTLYVKNIMVTTADADNKYVPYVVPITYPLTSTDLRGTLSLSGNNLVYDGDVYESDGTETVKYGYVDLGTLDWTYASTAGTYKRMRTSSVLSGVKKPAYSSTVAKILCAKYPTENNNDTYNGITGIAIHPDGYVYVYDPNYNTIESVSSFTTAMSGVYLIYELATPTTATLSPFVSPQICDKNGTEEFIDTRSVPMPVGHETDYYDIPDWMDNRYFDDLKAFPDKAEAEISTKAETTDIAPVENAATASKAYTTGQYIERPDGLYKVIADIASGGTFTVGTNISKDTVGAELVALNANKADNSELVSLTTSIEETLKDYEVLHSDNLLDYFDYISVNGATITRDGDDITVTSGAGTYRRYEPLNPETGDVAFPAGSYQIYINIKSTNSRARLATRKAPDGSSMQTFDISSTGVKRFNITPSVPFYIAIFPKVDTSESGLSVTFNDLMLSKTPVASYKQYSIPLKDRVNMLTEDVSHPSIPIDPTSSEIAGFPDGAMWLVTS